MKKFLISIVVVAMILTMSVAMVACGGGENVAGLPMYIGKTSPAEAGATAINKDMKGYEMFTAALSNYYDASYVASQIWGSVTTKVGVIETVQMVDAVKIRDGKGDINGNNANGATYYLHNASYSSFAYLYEKIYLDTEKVQYKNANVKYNRNDGIRISEWNDVVNYDSVAAITEATKSNPTLIWGYDTSEENLISISDPEYIKDEGVYKITLDFKPHESTIGYQENIKLQLKNAGQTLNSLEFKQLQIVIYIWENGMIRSMENKETYKMNMDLVGGIAFDSTVSLLSNIQFTYDKNEPNYSLSDFVKSFNDQDDKSYEKPYRDFQ